MRKFTMRDLASKISSRIASETLRRLQEHAVSHPNTRAIYGTIGVLADRYGYRAQHLTAAEHKVFSQNGEDGVIAEIFHRIGTESEYFVEFGAETGAECNTRFLADVLDWRGVYFEADETNFQGLSARFRNNQRIQTFKRHITPETINECFQLAGVPIDIDLLSIDVDGQDLWVWNALEDYRPRVVVVEYNSGLDPSGTMVEREGVYQGFVDTFGASIGALRKIGAEKGYRLVHCDLSGVNAFFVREDLVNSSFCDPVMRSPDYLLGGHRHRPGDPAVLRSL